MSIYLNTAEKQIKKGIVSLDIIKANLSKHFEIVDKQNWLETQRELYDQEFVAINTWIDENEVEQSETIDSGIGFDNWIKETNQILVGSITKTDANGVEYEEEIFEDVLIREFKPKESYDLEINDYLYNNAIFTDRLKDEALKTLDITTVTSGVSFYTDDKSIIDLMIARDEAIDQGAVDTDVTDWKTPSGIMEVTIFDIKEAVKLRLSNKAKLIGVEV